MANPFLSKKIIIPAIIFFGGLAVASGILISANLTAAQSFTTSQNSQWTQPAGEGISIPACFSSGGVNSTTCVGGIAQATLSWTSSHPVNLDVCRSFWCELIVYTPAGMYPGNNGWDAFTLPASGSVILSPLDSNTTYIYAFRDGTDMIAYPTFTTPNCAPFDYSLSNSDNITVTQGSSGFNTITATLVAGVTQSVSFVASGLPSGATASFNPASCNPNCSSTLTISTAPSTLAGTYPITVTGSPLNKTIIFNLVVNPVPPGDFNLSIGGGLACNSVPLSWTASAGTIGYRILKGAARVDITPYNPYTALNFTDNSVSENTTYLYQIEAYNGAGTNRSNARNVTTPYCPPTLDFFSDKTVIYEGQSVTLTWLSTYTISCAASGAWSGSKALNGNEIVIPLPPPSVTYNLQCFGPGGTTPVQPVTITITPLGLPGWKEIIPR